MLEKEIELIKRVKEDLIRVRQRQSVLSDTMAVEEITSAIARLDSLILLAK